MVFEGIVLLLMVLTIPFLVGKSNFRSGDWINSDDVKNFFGDYFNSSKSSGGFPSGKRVLITVAVVFVIFALFYLLHLVF